MSLLDATKLPLSDDPKRKALQERILSGANPENLSVMEKMKLGVRDNTITNFNGYELKPDHAYRATSKEAYAEYEKQGFICDDRPNTKEFDHEKSNNSGVHWYLGGVCPGYGEVFIECPAYEEYFQLADDNGCGMTANPNVRHILSSPKRNPVPFNLVRLIKHPDLEIDLSGQENAKVEPITKEEIESTGYYEEQERQKQELNSMIEPYKKTEENEIANEAALDEVQLKK